MNSGNEFVDALAGKIKASNSKGSISTKTSTPKMGSAKAMNPWGTVASEIGKKMAPGTDRNSHGWLTDYELTGSNLSRRTEGAQGILNDAAKAAFDAGKAGYPAEVAAVHGLNAIASTAGTNAVKQIDDAIRRSDPYRYSRPDAPAPIPTDKSKPNWSASIALRSAGSDVGEIGSSSAAGNRVSREIQGDLRSDGLDAAKPDEIANDYDAARDAGMTHAAASAYAADQAKETAVPHVTDAEKAEMFNADIARQTVEMVQRAQAILEAAASGQYTPNKPSAPSSGEQKRNDTDPKTSAPPSNPAANSQFGAGGAAQALKDAEKRSDEREAVREEKAREAEQEKKAKEAQRIIAEEEAEAEAKKNAAIAARRARERRAMDDENNGSNGGWSKPNTPQKTVDYEFEATRGAPRDNDDDRDDGPSTLGGPRSNSVSFSAASGSHDSGDSRDEPDNDGLENDGWAPGGMYHVGGVVSDDDSILNEDTVAVTAQEGEFVLSRAALDMLGVDLIGRVNGALRTGDRNTIARLQSVLQSRLGTFDALPEGEIKASMNERAYWDATDPEHTAANAHVAREFRVAYPGHSNMDKAEHIGGMITDRDPDTYLDDCKIDIPEGAFVVSRVATKLAGLPALMRLNALAEGNDAALAATLKRELEAALGIERPTSEAELKAMMFDPRYTNPGHPEYDAYRQMIAEGFRAAFPR